MLGGAGLAKPPSPTWAFRGGRYILLASLRGHSVARTQKNNDDKGGVTLHITSHDQGGHEPDGMSEDGHV